MSKPLAERANVLQQLAQELNPTFREWMHQHPAAVDDEGFHVVHAFAPQEPAADVLRDVDVHDHPVLVATLLNERLAVFELSHAPSSVDAAVTQLQGTDVTITDVAHAVHADEQHRVVLSLPGDRVQASGGDPTLK